MYVLDICRLPDQWDCVLAATVRVRTQAVHRCMLPERQPIVTEGTGSANLRCAQARTPHQAMLESGQKYLWSVFPDFQHPQVVCFVYLGYVQISYQ